MNLEDLITTVTKVASIATGLGVILAFLSAFFKPVRKFARWIVSKIIGRRDKNKDVIEAMEHMEERLTNKIDAKINEVSGRCEVLSAKIDAVSGKCDEVEKMNDMNEVDRVRFEILDFSNSCRNGRKHSAEEFGHIMNLNEKYEKLLDKYEISNGEFKAAYQYIMMLYNDPDRSMFLHE